MFFCLCQAYSLNKGALDLFLSMVVKHWSNVTSKFGREFICIFLNLVLNKTLFVHQICTIILLSASLYKVNKEHGILMNYVTKWQSLFLLISYPNFQSPKLKLTQDIYLQYKEHLQVNMHVASQNFFFK